MNPNIAKTKADAATYKQVACIKAILRPHGINAEAECQRLYGCDLASLSRRAAHGWIERLKRGRAA